MSIVAAGPPPALSQQPSNSPWATRIPDSSGLQFVDSYVPFTGDLTSISNLCDLRRAGIERALQDTKDKLAKMDERTDPLGTARTYAAHGLVCFYKGDLEGAARAFENVLRIAAPQADTNPDLRSLALIAVMELGVAQLRRGEVENCALNHNAEMCIFPLSAAARHKATAGSEAAIDYFQSYLQIDPSNLEVRWLLNVAYQTLGLYPDKVPPQYLIPPEAFASKEDIGRFPDVAPALGLDSTGNAGAGIVDDFDNDGNLDIVQTGTDACEPMHLYHNNGDGTFADVTAKAGLADQLGGLNAIQCDYNNDGWLDLFVMRGGWEYRMRNSLLRNNKDGTFTDVTKEAGLMSVDHKTHSSAWADFDNDGWVDVFVAHELTPSQLFRNNGDGTFTDVTAKAGVGTKIGLSKGVVAGDYDGDGFVDYYVSNFDGPNFLYHNRGDGTFEEVAGALGVTEPIKSFPCWFFDFDNDGNLDLFCSSYTMLDGEWVRYYLGMPRQQESIKLYRNTGKGTFEDVTAKVGLDRAVAAMGGNFGDLDNDGWLDFYLATGSPSYSALMPNLMYRNHDGKYFVDVTTSTGTGHLQKGHGVSFADVDNDGNEDVYENLGGAIPGDKYNKALFHNPGHANDWISIKLVGVKSNRMGVGAKIKVTLSNGQIRYREVTSGGSFGSNPLAQHIGLGKAAKIATVEVTWPASKTKQVFRDVPANQYIEIKEMAKTFTTRQIRPIALKLDAMPAHHHGN